MPESLSPPTETNIMPTSLEGHTPSEDHVTDSVRYHELLPAARELAESGYEVARDKKDALLIAFSGVRRAVTNLRLYRTERKIQDLETTQNVRPEIATAVSEGRLPAPEAAPVTRGERKLAMRASRRRTKAMNRAANQIRKQGVYGSSDARGKPFIKENRPIYEIVDDGDGGKKIAITHNVTEIRNDLGTPKQEERLKTGRYSRGERKSEMSTARRYKRDGVMGEVNKYLIARGVLGNTVRDNIINLRKESKLRKSERLASKVAKTERSREHRKALRESRRPARH